MSIDEDFTATYYHLECNEVNDDNIDTEIELEWSCDRCEKELKHECETNVLTDLRHVKTELCNECLSEGFRDSFYLPKEPGIPDTHTWVSLSDFEILSGDKE